MALLMVGCYVNEFDETNNENTDNDKQQVIFTELKQKIELFSSEITPIAIHCSGAKEMEAHLKDIKEMKDVKLAWVEDNALCIEDKQGFIHIWDFQDETIEENIGENNFARQISVTSGVGTRANTYTKSACIIMTDDIGVYRNNDKNYLTDLLNKHGYEVTFVSGNDYTPDYFVSNQYKSEKGKQSKLRPFSDHDLYIIRVHGCFIDNLRTHWLSTDLTLTNKDMTNNNLDNDFYKTYPWLKARTSNGRNALGFLYKFIQNKELPFYSVDVMISEDFFIEYCDKFTKEKPIILCSACESMAYNINLASTFVDKKDAGVFLGMTAINTHGRFAIMRILQLMLDYNYSFQGALNALERFDIKYYQIGKKDGIGRWHTFTGSDLMDWLPRDFDCVLNPHEAIDMGTSVKWARWNIGTNNIYELGDSLRWAETKPWSYYLYNASLMDFPRFGKIPDGGIHFSTGLVDRKFALDYDYPGKSIGGNPQYDAATANWGKDWRLPTKEEFEELLDESKFKIERIIETTPNYLRITNKTDPSKVIVFPYPNISWFSLSSYVCPYWTSDHYHCVNDKGEDELEGWSMLFAGSFPIMSDCPGYYAGYARGVQPK